MIEGIAGLKDLVGAPASVSDWITVDQQRIDRFADTTEDRQWIHVDPYRAAQESPYKTTIAHGFLTLSLLSRFAEQAIPVGGLKMAVNYGLNRVRFTAPVPSGSRIRGKFTLAEITDIPAGAQVVWTVEIEREGTTKPVCVAEWVVRYYE